jgi:hypothetical protein
MSGTPTAILEDRGERDREREREREREEEGDRGVRMSVMLSRGVRWQ